ncbi:MAG: hypothetical protein KF822_12430 [Steroidobacteraceae bacterium]|nr:hypothetical protein [Steroidobacteraceae bacterium]
MLWTDDPAPSPQPATLRHFMGQSPDGTALLLENHCAWPCDFCKRRRRVAVTVLAPFMKGRSRPRDHVSIRALTVCWRCLLGPVVRVLFGRKPKITSRRTVR